MMSDEIFPQKFQKIDDLTRPKHRWIESNDICLYLCEYAAGQGYQHSYINQQIFNFKKLMSERDKPGWHYKASAIRKIASAFTRAFKGLNLADWTFVPLPPSKMPSDVEHDDRVMKMLRHMQPQQDVRELICQSQSVQPSHKGGPRLQPDQLAKLYTINETLSDPAPNNIFAVDDILTTGAHFKAAQIVLQNRFPSADIVGLFVARAVH